MANNQYVNKVEYGGNVLIDISSDTVTANDILATKTAHDKSGAPITGNIVNKGSTGITVSGGTSTVIPAGYYNGSGSVTVSDANLVAGNIKENVTILGVIGTFQGGGSSTSTSVTVTPSVNSQIVLPSIYSVDYFDEVDVNAIPYSETDNIAGGKTADIGDNATSINKLALAVGDNVPFSVDASDLAGITQIRDSAFNACSSLTSITIPDSVTSIGEAAFSGCSGLTSITIPDSVTSIGRLAFSNCTSLTSITIPDSVTSIGQFAFRGCSGLTSIVIPDSVTVLESYSFYQCTSLVSVHLSNNLTTIGINAFYECSSLISVVIPEGVTTIGNSVFWRCTNLANVTLAGTVTSIGSQVFGYCTSLTSIVSLNLTPPTIQSNTFQDVSTSTPVYVPAGSVSAYQSAQYWSNFSNIQAIPS